MNAINEAFAALQPEAPAGETAAEEAPAASDSYTVTAKGLMGTFPVTVAFNEDKTVKSVTLGESDNESDKPFLAMANTEEFLSQFTGMACPIEGVDTVGGATTSKTSIVNAINEAFAQAQ